MPVLYDMAIYMQDEFMEQFVEQEGPLTDSEDSKNVSITF